MSVRLVAIARSLGILVEPSAFILSIKWHLGGSLLSLPKTTLFWLLHSGLDFAKRNFLVVNQARMEKPK